MSVLSGGHNPVFGRDPGPPPPFTSAAGPAFLAPDVGPPPPGTMATAPPGYYGIPGQPPMMYYCNPFFPPPPYTATAPPGLGAAVGMDAQGLMYQYVSGLAGSGRFPQAAPPVDPDFPAAHHLNSTGGAGVEPGFNYFFPTEHALVIVLKSAAPPWTLVPGSYDHIPFHAAKVPANITMAELLVGFGADNPDKAKNQFWEVYPQGGGAWGWCEHCTGDDPVMMARSVREMGWLEKRGGKQQTIFLWISKS